MRGVSDGFLTSPGMPSGRERLPGLSGIRRTRTFRKTPPDPGRSRRRLFRRPGKRCGKGQRTPDAPGFGIDA